MVLTLTLQKRQPVFSNFLKFPDMVRTSRRRCPSLPRFPVLADGHGGPARRHVLRDLLGLVQRQHHAAQDRLREARRAADLPGDVRRGAEVAEPVGAPLGAADLECQLPLVPLAAGEDRGAVLLHDLLQLLLDAVPVPGREPALDEEHRLVPAGALEGLRHALHASVLPGAPPWSVPGPPLYLAIVLSIPTVTHDSTASAASSNDFAAASRSEGRNLPSTKSAESAASHGPIPIRRRGYSRVPRAASTSERPLWPPADPEARIRSVPRGRAKSSATTMSPDRKSTRLNSSHSQ